jgi:ABC-type sugar transport system ATPase subunit
MRIIAQDFNLNTYAKAYDNIAGMLSNTNLQLKQEKTEQAMEFLNIAHLANKRVVDLSGGEQQRVAIARAIITEPEVLLMDEPFSQVDSLLKNKLRDDVRRLAHELGITIVIVSHDPADGLSLADEMLILRNGRMVEIGAPEDIYNDPKELFTAQLLANCQVISATDAIKIGLKPKKKLVAIYPEWVKSAGGWSGKSFTVVNCYFKGFYEELLIERNGVHLRALNVNAEQFRKGDKVSVSISRCLDFD